MKRLLIGLLFVAVTTHATEPGDHTALFEEAVDAINWNFDDEWAYTETRLEDDVLWVARFDPRKPVDEQWTLKSVGGRAPTRDELRDFAHDKEDHDSSDGSQRTNIVGADTLELVEETDEHWTFNFIPEEDEIGFGKGVDAVAKIAKDGPFLESVNIRNRTDLKPGFGTKLTTFQFQMRFGPTTDGRAIVPLAMKVKVVGRALLFIGFEETEVVTYSDFEFANPDSDLSP